MFSKYVKKNPEDTFVFMILIVIGLVAFFSRIHATDVPCTYAVSGTLSVSPSVAVLFAVMPYELQKVKKAPITFKAPLNFKKEGTAILNLGDVALFNDGKICILRRTKLPWYTLDYLITQCLDRLFYGAVSPYEFIIAAPKWNLYQRDSMRHELHNDVVGVSFDFPVSQTPDPTATPPWVGYFVYEGKSIPAAATKLIIDYTITATPGITWNYQSDPSNTGCPYALPALRVYIASGPIYATDEAHRWWYQTSTQLADMGGNTVRVTVPLDGVGWSGIYAAQAIDNLSGFRATVTGADWVGITFGGGCAYSHGVNVFGGTAKFNLQRMYCE